MRSLALLLLCACALAHEADMPVRQRLGVSGLWTDPNPHTDVPDGALLRADNVVFRRKGMVEPRPGFKAGSDTEDLEQLYALISYDGIMVRVGKRASDAPDDGTANGGNTFDDTNGDNPVFSAMVTLDHHDRLTFDRDNIRGLETRGNLYLTTSDKLRRITAGDDGVALPAGLIPPNVTIGATTGSSGFLADGYSVSYRVTLARIDSNQLITESAPSGRYVVRNNTGGTRNTQLTVTWHQEDGYTPLAEDFSTGMKFKIYRSEQVTATIPDDEHFLISEVWVDGSQGTFDFADTLLDTALSAALYTNDTATNGGAQASNYRMPPARDLALYKGSLFAANVVDFPRRTFTYLDNQVVTGSATGIGNRQVTGKRHSASNTISNLSSTTGLEVGMMLSDNTGWSVATPATPVVISGISGTDVTVTANWGGSTDGGTVTLHWLDTICIGAPNTAANYHRADLAAYFVSSILNGLGATFGGGIASDDVCAFGVGDQGFFEPSVSASLLRTVTIEGFTALDTDSFMISATHGGEYNPVLPTCQDPDGVAQGFAESNEVEVVHATPLRNVVAWSPADLPEHRHLADRDYVGQALSPVLRAFATRDGVWLLKGKGDGIHLLTGFGALSGFRVDQFDLSTYLLHPGLACATEDAVYAWTNKGMVQITAGGVVPISDPAIGVDVYTLQMVLDHESGAGLSAFAVANIKDKEVIFGLPPVALTGTAVERTYAFNTDNKGWGTWFGDEVASLSTGAFDDSTRFLWFGTNASGTPRVERSPRETYVTHADAEFALLIDDIDGDEITLDAEVDGWTPEVGDLLRVGTGFSLITAITSTTVFTVEDGTALAEAAGVAYKAFTSRLAWTLEAAGQPSALKRYSEIVTHFEDTWGLGQWSSQQDSSRDFGTVVTKAREIDYARATAPRDDRTLVARAHTMASRFYPGVLIKQADARWRISGETIVFEVMTTRLHR